MSALEIQPGKTYRSHGGRVLLVTRVNAATVMYLDGEQDIDSIPLEAPRWLFESIVKERIE